MEGIPEMPTDAGQFRAPSCLLVLQRTFHVGLWLEPWRLWTCEEE
jgi:hypothetical protein